MLSPEDFGARVRDRWLPEAVDPRAWRSRCGYAPTGIRRETIDVTRPDMHADARAELARRAAARARGEHVPDTSPLLQAVDYLGSRASRTRAGAWTDRDDHEIREIGPRVPLELLAVALRRLPSAVARRADALDVMIDRGDRGLYVIEEDRGVRRLVLDELDRDLLTRIGAPISWSLADIARAAGVSGVGALKACRRLGVRPAIPRRAKTTRGTFERGNVALHAAVYTPIGAWRVIVAVESERRRRAAPRPVCPACGERPATRDGPVCSTCSARERKRRSRSRSG